MRFHPFAGIALYARLIAIVALAGCAGSGQITLPGTAPVVVSTPVAAPPPATLAQFTNADFATAIVMAQSAVPQDVEAISCFSYLQAQLAVFNAQASGLIAPTGIVSTFEASHLGVNLVNGGFLNPAQKAGVELNCGPLFLNIAGGLNQMLAKFGIASAGLSIGLPGL